MPCRACAAGVVAGCVRRFIAARGTDVASVVGSRIMGGVGGCVSENAVKRIGHALIAAAHSVVTG